MKVRICVYLLGLVVFVSGCSIFTDNSTTDVTPEIVAIVTDTPAVTQTPLPDPPTVSTNGQSETEGSDLLPDLKIVGVGITAENPNECDIKKLVMGSRVIVANAGTVPVGNIQIAINDKLVTIEEDIVPGSQSSLWIQSSYNMQVPVKVDPNNLIVESDEENNLFNDPVAIPTPPAPCTPTPEPTPAAMPVDEVELEWVAGGLIKPLFVTHASDGRLFVVEQRGTIRIIEADGSVNNTLYLDMTDRTNSGRNEQGLLGLAFHPNYQQNGRFFVNYTHADGSTVVSEFQVSADPSQADAGSERQLLKISQPYSNHNGGMIAFGPDGFLYIGLGDGGSQDDPENRAQNLNELLGKILRIDIDGAEPYGIPADNPFVGNDAARNEIWSVGWRNPWRFSFDRATGNMFVADVGQNQIEEISLNRAGVGGLNFGWRIFEGNECYLDDCTTADLQPAIAQYTHAGGHCSVTGGYMHRGTESVALNGNYFFADYCSSQMWRLFPDGNGGDEMLALSRPGFLVSSFGEGVNGEIYLVSQNGGEIYRIVPTQ